MFRPAYFFFRPAKKLVFPAYFFFPLAKKMIPPARKTNPLPRKPGFLPSVRTRHLRASVVSNGAMKNILVVLGGALLVSFPACAQTVSRTSPPFLKRVGPDSVNNSALPLRNVVLFSSGVGYFGRSGQVNGDASVDLNVRAPQISDILKSLTLFDPKGRVDPVTYSISDYLAARPTSTDLSIDPAATPGAILRLLQGALVRIEKPSGTVEGRVVSVSTQTIRDKDPDTVRTVEFATLLTARGLTTIRLDDVSSFFPLDPALSAKFAASLDKTANGLTRGLDNGVRPVTLHFRGRGAREVRAGYLLETPAWKTSYRLVLGPKTKPYLQGWAVVENPGDEDWQDVNLSLVSGRPISFIQDLATPVYIVRPVVEPQIIGSPTPQTFGAGFGGEAERELNNRVLKLEGRPVPAPAMPRSALRATGGKVFQNNGAYNAPAGAALADAASAAQTGVQNKVEAQATGADRGNLFVYAIDSKVSIPRGQAAMVPILGEDVEGEAISIVQSDGGVHALDAQNGFLLRNRGDLNLQGGPITVYSDGIYGGDALVSNVSPGEARLIAYAVDLDLVSRLESAPEEEEITAIRATGGALQVTKRDTRTQNYIFRNKSKQDKIAYLQQPNEDEWKLIDPKQLYEKSNDGLRFRVSVPTGKTVKYAIKWEKPEVEVVALRDLNPAQIGFYTVQTRLSPELKAQLLQIIALKKKANDLAYQRAASQQTLRAISEGQTRIRENMKALDRTSALYKSYSAKLAAQETEIDRLTAEVDRLQAAENAARQAVSDAIANLGGVK